MPLIYALQNFLWVCRFRKSKQIWATRNYSFDSVYFEMVSQENIVPESLNSSERIPQKMTFGSFLRQGQGQQYQYALAVWEDHCAEIPSHK